MLTESDEKKQILYDFTRIWNLKKKKKNKQKLIEREMTSNFQREKGLRWTNG